MRKSYLLILFCIFVFRFPIFAAENHDCLILLDRHDTENIGRLSCFFLTSKLQSAIVEQTTPILLHASIWNSFVERRTLFGQKALQNGSNEQRLLTLYNEIKSRGIFWSLHYNKLNDDSMQNKALVVQRINEEFYSTDIDVSDMDYQMLVNYITAFDQKDWDIYQKNGFYLLIPKKYSVSHSTIGFNTDKLEKVENCLDVALNYFASNEPSSLVEVLPQFFTSQTDSLSLKEKWNIVLSGHGGSYYSEQNEGQNITWNGEPLIADLTLQEFKGVLDFFNTKLKTHVLHYSSCYAGGNHIELAFDKKYNFAIICECLTDCVTYCQWTNTLPSSQKKSLNIDDLYYDPTSKSWHLNMTSPNKWSEFFQAISKVDFTAETIDKLPAALANISYPIIANISLLRLPEANRFNPLTSADTFKIDDHFISFESLQEKKEDIFLNGTRVLLLESESIDSNLALDNAEKLRIISIKPGEATHYIKKMALNNPVDLPSIFWQAEFQIFDKTFLIDECIFACKQGSKVFENENKVTIKKLLVKQQNNFFGHFLRLFFTMGDKAMMIVAKQAHPYELDEKVSIQEVIELSPEAKKEYEHAYDEQRNQI